MPSLRRDYFLQMQEEREISHGEIARGNKKKEKKRRKKALLSEQACERAS
jgi:hypothetical protein